MDRREALMVGGLLMAGSALNAKETTHATNINPAYGTSHAVVPLPFDATKLKGISEKVIVSHHKNNYSGAVKKLGILQKQIAAMPDSAHPIEYGALKKEELIALNSKLLHELYFTNLGGNGVMPLDVENILKQSFGSLEAWKHDFVKTAKSLSGGSGWIILTYLKAQGIVMHQIASDHSDSTVTGVPLLVLDMYEHSYHMDYGANAGAYIHAFMDNIDWRIVSERFKMA